MESRLKIILLTLFFSIGLVGNSYAQICNEDSNVQKRNGVVFLPNKTKPFSGQNLCIYDNQQYKVKGEFTEGLKDGNWTYWAKNGIKKTEETYELGNIQTKTIFSSKLGRRAGKCLSKQKSRGCKLRSSQYHCPQSHWQLSHSLPSTWS